MKESDLDKIIGNCVDNCHHWIPESDSKLIEKIASDAVKGAIKNIINQFGHYIDSDGNTVVCLNPVDYSSGSDECVVSGAGDSINIRFKPESIDDY